MKTQHYDGSRLCLYAGQLSVDETVKRLEAILREKHIPVFAKFDHALNAKKVGLDLHPTTVLVFGSPQVGTGLMQENQSISLDLPLRIAVWEDEAGSTWLAFPKTAKIAEAYGLEDHPAVPKMEALMENLVQAAARP
ncbi:DUF302 domain-containing protein [Eubacterium sp. 1001713B170207_170306_E7]|uniref:DUF302 domain-containing protein n=1 Tax=Eubacterium sp. 1001713B170207_170306_E7 TaxID=2787097 RepID=UPI00189B6484|nr:DUF302 domain-containing protein [Eubacterium sp. 1001713B170207_170306_E7]